MALLALSLLAAVHAVPVDTSDMCEMWASSGECDANPDYMRQIAPPAARREGEARRLRVADEARVRGLRAAGRVLAQPGVHAVDVPRRVRRVGGGERAADRPQRALRRVVAARQVRRGAGADGGRVQHVVHGAGALRALGAQRVERRHLRQGAALRGGRQGPRLRGARGGGRVPHPDEPHGRPLHADVRRRRRRRAALGAGRRAPRDPLGAHRRAVDRGAPLRTLLAQRLGGPQHVQADAADAVRGAAHAAVAAARRARVAPRRPRRRPAHVPARRRQADAARRRIRR